MSLTEARFFAGLRWHRNGDGCPMYTTRESAETSPRLYPWLSLVLAELYLFETCAVGEAHRHRGQTFDGEALVVSACTSVSRTAYERVVSFRFVVRNQSSRLRYRFPIMRQAIPVAEGAPWARGRSLSGCCT